MRTHKDADFVIFSPSFVLEWGFPVLVSLNPSANKKLFLIGTFLKKEDLIIFPFFFF